MPRPRDPHTELLSLADQIAAQIVDVRLRRRPGRPPFLRPLLGRPVCPVSRQSAEQARPVMALDRPAEKLGRLRRQKTFARRPLAALRQQLRAVPTPPLVTF